MGLLCALPPGPRSTWSIIRGCSRTRVETPASGVDIRSKALMGPFNKCLLPRRCAPNSIAVVQVTEQHVEGAMANEHRTPVRHTPYLWMTAKPPEGEDKDMDVPDLIARAKKAGATVLGLRGRGLT